MKEGRSQHPCLEGEDNTDSDGGPRRLNPLQLLNAIKAENGEPQKGLMYVATLIKGKMVFTMMDTGASHNFIDKQMIKVPRVESE